MIMKLMIIVTIIFNDDNNNNYSRIYYDTNNNKSKGGPDHLSIESMTDLTDYWPYREGGRAYSN